MGALQKIEKVCGFYVSNMHFATMILPFVNKKLKDKVNFYTFFEVNLKSNVKTILKGVIAKTSEKEEILNVNWRDTKVYKYLDIENNMKDKLADENIILICGGEEYIDRANVYLNKFFERNVKKIENKKIKIVDCYGVENFSDNIREILNAHDKIINTSGEHEISEVFQGYQKKII